MTFGEFFEQYWSFAAVAVFVYMAGVVSKKLVKRFWPVPLGATEPGVVRGIYDATLPMYPLLAGAAFGLVPLPVPDWVGDGISRCAWFMLAGALCGQIYELVKRLLGAASANRSRNTQPPGEPEPPGP